MSKKNPYIVQFSGLKLGNHSFDFEIGKSFFDAFESTELDDCNVKVHLEMEKSTSMMVLNFEIEGEVTCDCDRCLESAVLPIEGEYRQIVKFSDYEDAEENDEITILPTAEYELDISKFIFDFILLSVPFKRVHPEDGCDPEILAKLNDYIIEEAVEEEDDSTEPGEDEIDPRWKALMNLKNSEN